MKTAQRALRNTTNVVLFSLLGLLTANSIGQEVGQEVGSESDSIQEPRNHPFFQILISASRSFSMPITFRESVERSELIVRGYIDTVAEGRALSRKGSRRVATIHTSLMKIRVTKVLKGDAGEYVYIEYSTGGYSSEAIDKVRYTEEMVFFLREGGRYVESAYSIVDSPIGLMHEVSTLYSLVRDTGLFAVGTGANGQRTLVTPLSGGSRVIDPPEEFDSFDDLEREIPSNQQVYEQVEPGRSFQEGARSR